MSDTTRISYGYHAAPTSAVRDLRRVRINAATADAKQRFPMWVSVQATLDPDRPATGPILVEVTIPTNRVGEVYGR